MTPLLDANVLTAIVVADHVHHDAVERWFASSDDSFATYRSPTEVCCDCLIREGQTADNAQAVLNTVKNSALRVLAGLRHLRRRADERSPRPSASNRLLSCTTHPNPGQLACNLRPRPREASHRYRHLISSLKVYGTDKRGTQHGLRQAFVRKEQKCSHGTS